MIPTQANMVNTLCDLTSPAPTVLNHSRISAQGFLKKTTKHGAMVPLLRCSYPIASLFCLIFKKFIFWSPYFQILKI
jgi:hypothetical protein